jgi:DNA repair exonuclease SbcCD ATPase subunit
MRIISVTAKNFMSFRELNYEFPESGLVFVGGDVVGSQTSNSNGAGKSTMFEAVCWGIYGRSLRDIPVREVVNWSEGRGCFVEIVFSDDQGKLYVVQRYRDDKQHQNSLYLFLEGNDITLQDSKTTQDLIESRIGMTWPVFSTAVVFGEQATRFTQARDSEKKAIFDEILMLQRFPAALKSLREDMRGVQEKQREAKSRISYSEESFESFVRDFNEAEKGLKKLEEEEARAKDLHDTADKELTSVKADLLSKQSAHDSLLKVQEELSQRDTELMGLMIDAEKEKASFVASSSGPLVEARVKMNQVISNIEKIKDRIKSVGTLKGKESCPTCGQKIEQGSIEGVTAHYKEEMGALAKERSELEQTVLSLTKEEASNRSKHDKAINELIVLKSTTDRELRETKTAIISSDSDIKRWESKIKILESGMENLLSTIEDRKSLLQQQLAIYTKKMEEHEKAYTDLQRDLESAVQEEKYYKFWEEGFGNSGVKSFLLDEILPSLNDRISYYASALIGEQRKIVFDTESQLRSGASRDKFDVGIYQGERKIEYGACSGGEKRRVDVAILLALQSLVFERNAGKCNLMVLDEVFDSLDRTGIEKAVGLLSEESKDKAIYVISHVNEFRDYFEKELIIRNEGGVSSIVMGG